MNKVANRRGSNIRLYKYTDGSLFMSIPFGRITAPDVSSDRVWARGGQADANMVPFDEPMTGTFTITTQIIPIELIALACSDSGATTGVDEWARREVLTAEADNSDIIITLSKAPIAGTLYCYLESSDAEGTPLTATNTGTRVVLTGVTAGQKVVAYYFSAEATAKHCTFSNDAAPGAYIIYSDTTYKDATNTIVAEQMKCFKAIPQKRISLSYQGSGDPVSMDLVFDLLEDDEGRVLDVRRL